MCGFCNRLFLLDVLVCQNQKITSHVLTAEEMLSLENVNLPIFDLGGVSDYDLGSE